MSRLLLALLLAFVVAAPLAAQVSQHYVPAPSAPNVGGQNNWPFNIYTDWRFSFILPASAMPTAPVKILDMAFAPSFYSGRIFTSPRFEMRMNHTTFANYNVAPAPNCFDAILGKCPTTVYNGAIRWDCSNVDNWTDIGMQCPFGYDVNKGSLVTEIRYTGGNSGQSQGCVIRTDPSIPRAYTHNGYSQAPFTEPCWFVPIPGQFLGPKVRLTIDASCIMTCDATVSISQPPGNINIINGPAAAFYQVATSFSNGPPGINLGPCKVCLGTDDLLFLSLQLGPPLFNSYAGQLPASGNAQATVAPPRLGALVGMCLYHAAVVFDSQGIKCCTNACGMEIQL